jgi:hypothetical protein
MDDIKLKDSNKNIWSKVIDNKYYIKLKPLTLDDYVNWKDYFDSTNIVNNIYFDPNIGELIIITDDENIAIVVAYTILNNFIGINNFEDSKLLLNGNIEKIKGDDIFKNKLIDNIFNNLNRHKNIKDNNEQTNKKSKKHENSNISKKYNNSEDKNNNYVDKNNSNPEKFGCSNSNSNSNIESLNNAKLLTTPIVHTSNDIEIEAFNDDLDAFDNINYSYIQ